MKAFFIAMFSLYYLYSPPFVFYFCLYFTSESSGPSTIFEDRIYCKIKFRFRLVINLHLVSDEELKSSRLFYCDGTSRKLGGGEILSTSKYSYPGFFMLTVVDK